MFDKSIEEKEVPRPSHEMLTLPMNILRMGWGEHAKDASNSLDLEANLGITLPRGLIFQG